MIATTECNKCGSAIEYEKANGGQPAKCETCGEVLRLPIADGLPTPRRKTQRTPQSNPRPQIDPRASQSAGLSNWASLLQMLAIFLGFGWVVASVLCVVVGLLSAGIGLVALFLPWCGYTLASAVSIAVCWTLALIANYLAELPR